MTENIWRALAEVTQQDGAGGDQALLEHLTAAVDQLHLPPSFLERIMLAVAEAVRRAWQHEKGRAARVTIAAHVLQPEGGPIDQSWGFFLIEKRTQDTADRRIEVLLYLEAR